MEITELPAWKHDNLCLVHPESDRRLRLGDNVCVNGVVVKSVAVFDYDIDPTIRATCPVHDIENGRIDYKLVRQETYESIIGTIVGFRDLQPARTVDIDLTGQYGEKYTSYRTVTAKRRPYLLVCFWPTHKPVLVDPYDAEVDDTMTEYDMRWRKNVPESPDKAFWRKVSEQQEAENGNN